MLKFVDHAQDDEDVSGLLEGLRKAIDDYKVRPRPQIPPPDINKGSRWYNKWRYMIKGTR